jgi:phosphohistidine phosphatase
MQKILIILRHGKAEVAKSGQDDHERPLAERGKVETDRMGAYAAAHSIHPQKILCSTAVRTRGTLKCFLDGKNGPVPEVEYVDKIYNASENQLLQAIASQPENVETLMVIGHNPGLHQLALRFALKGEPAMISQIVAEFPTCALARIDLGAIAWRDVRKSQGMLSLFVTPKLI